MEVSISQNVTTRDISLNIQDLDRLQWHMPVILATCKAEIRRISLRTAQVKTVQDPMSTNSWVQWHVPVTPIYMGG
jgi:hypothetical protein